MNRLGLGMMLGVMMFAGRGMAQQTFTYTAAVDPNGNMIATKTLPDGTVVPVDLRSQGIVLDPGDLGMQFTVGDTPAAAVSVPKGERPKLSQEQIEQQAADRLARQLRPDFGCTDEEWDVLGPKIRAIELLQA